jgi:O-antigen/teichoic acid export membrane protein
MILARVVKAFTLSGLILAVNFAGQILSVPILMAHWGIRSYGAWIVLASLGSSVTLMNLGVQSYVTNQLVLATARGRIEEGERLLGSALKIYSVFCLVALGVIAALCALNLTSFLDTGGLTRGESTSIVLAHALLAVYGILGGLLINLLRVGEQLPRQLVYGLVERILFLSIPIGFAIGGASPVSASWGIVAALGLVAAFVLRDVFRRSPVPVSPSAGSLRQGFQMVLPSLFFFGSALSTQLLATGVTLVISSEAGSVAVATFTTALMMTNAFRLILNQVVNVLSAEVTLLSSREDLSRLRAWYRFLWKGSTSATIVVAALLCPMGTRILEVWTRFRVQVDFSLNGLLTLYLVVHAAGILSIGFGLAMNKQRPIFFVQLASGLGALLLSAALVERLGLHGIAWSLLVTQIVSTAALTRMNCRWLDQPTWAFLRDTLGRGILTLAFALVAVTATRDLESFPPAIAAAFSAGGCLLLTWFTWLNSGERHWLRGLARELVQQHAFRPRPVSLPA